MEKNLPRKTRNPRSRFRLWIFATVSLVFVVLISLKIQQSSTSTFASADLNSPRVSGSPEKFGASEYCGLCHTDIYQQWNASSHHFSSFNNPIYRKVAINTLQEKGTEALQFCSGCHDPLLSAQRLSTLSTTDTSALLSWEFNAGITCLSCHRIVSIGDQNGHLSNGNFHLEEPTLHPFALSNNPQLQQLHKWSIELTPFLHSAVVDKPFYAQAKYCASCHTLSVPASINGAHPMKIFDEYGDWAASDYAKQGQMCSDCHMKEIPSNDPAAKDGLIKNHSFAAGHTALAVFNRDDEHVEKAQQFLHNKLQLHTIGVRRQGSQSFVPLKDIDLHPGDRLELAIVVANTGVGHNFPAGTADSNQAWLSFHLYDAHGALLYTEGDTDNEGRLANDVIRFGITYTDELGNPTHRGTTTTRGIYTTQNTVIPAGASRQIHWPLTVPATTSGSLILKINLNWRKYAPEFINWVFDGRTVPSLPITTIATLNINIPLVTQPLSRASDTDNHSAVNNRSVYNNQQQE